MQPYQNVVQKDYSLQCTHMIWRETREYTGVTLRIFDLRTISLKGWQEILSVNRCQRTEANRDWFWETGGA